MEYAILKNIVMLQTHFNISFNVYQFITVNFWEKKRRFDKLHRN